MKTPSAESILDGVASNLFASRILTARRAPSLFKMAGLLVAGVMLAGTTASAATNTLNKTGTTWNSAADWSSGNLPSSTDALQINTTSSGSSTLDNSYTVQTLSFDTGAATITINNNATGTVTNTLTLTGGTNALGGTDIIATSSTTTGAVNMFTGTTTGNTVLNIGSGGGINAANANETLTVGSASVTLTSGASPSGTITFDGAGTVFAAWNGLSYNGAYLVQSGTLKLSNSTTNSNNVLYIASGAAVNLNNSTGANVAGLQNVSGSGGTLENLSGSRNINIVGSGTYTFGGLIMGSPTNPLATAVTVNSNSVTQTLTGANTYGGGTTVSAGTLVISNAGSTTNLGTNNAMGTGTVTMSGSGSAVLSLLNDGAGGVSTGTVNYGNVLTWTASTATINIGSVTSGVTNKTLELGATKIGNNTMTVTGQAGYTLELGAATQGSTASSSATTFNPIGASMSIASITGAANAGNVNAISLGGNSTGNYVTGAITNSLNGQVAISKINTSTWNLQGQNTYTGTTTVSGGTLIVSGTTTSATVVNTGSISGVGTTAGNLYVSGSIGSTVSVANGTTLGGTGSTGVVTVAGGGAVNLADNTIGTLTVGGLTIGGATASSMTFEITAGSTGNLDNIADGGILTLNNANGTNIVISNLGSNTTLTNGLYNLITYTGAYTGSLTNLNLTTTTLDGHTLALVQGTGAIELQVSGGSTGASSTTYTLATTAGSNLVHQSGTTTLTTTIVNTGSSTSDTLNYSGLGASASQGTVTGTTTSGGPVANGNGSASNGQSYVATTAGVATISSTGTGTNATLGTGATQSNTTGTTITVYTGQSTWTGTASNGSWGTLTTGFGTNWGTNQGSPGLDPNFTSVDTATFNNISGQSTELVRLDGASPSLNGLTFNGSATAYTLAQGSGGTISFNGGAGQATINDMAGAQTISAPVSLTTGVNVNVSSGQSLTFSGAISGSGSITTLTGTGTTYLTASGGNTYTGGTSVKNGSLLISNATGSALGSGPLSVARGATFGGAGLATISRFDIGNSGSGTATVQVGNGTDATSQLIISGTTSTGTPNTIANASLTFNLDSTNTNSNELLVGNSTINFTSSQLTLNLLGTSVIQENTLYTLIVGTGSNQYTGLTTAVNSLGQTVITGGLSAAYSNALAQSYYNNSYLVLVQSAGVDDIDVVVVPEPSTWALTLGGFICLLATLRRKSKRLQ